MNPRFPNLLASPKPTPPWRHLWLCVLLALAFTSRLAAADSAADFTAANELYAKGQFAAAAAQYQKLLQTAGHSPALLFNCGNAEFKAGHLGKAIAAYREAELLSPRDPELRANLAFVRNQVQASVLRPSRWQNWVGSLTLNEGTVLTATLLWIFFALLVARQLRPALIPRLRGATRLAGVLVILAGTVLGLQAGNHFCAPVAVITEPEAAALSGPFADAQAVFTARDGAEVRILDRHDDWVQIAGAAGKIGWVNTRQAAVLPGA